MFVRNAMNSPNTTNKLDRIYSHPVEHPKSWSMSFSKSSMSDENSVVSSRVKFFKHEGVPGATDGADLAQFMADIG